MLVASVALSAVTLELVLLIDVANALDTPAITLLIDVIAFVFVVMFVLLLSILVAIVAERLATVADIATLSPPITNDVALTVPNDWSALRARVPLAVIGLVVVVPSRVT